jgi:ribosomal protein S18 acetylase RimI-like enzyme
MQTIEYRTATTHDSDQIADLHANSWLDVYRGLMPDSYLDNNVHQERREYWAEKLKNLTDKEFAIVAVSNNKVKGFCAVLDKPENDFDALVDNLHVSRDMKGKGIGSALMSEAVTRLKLSGRNSFYLWVVIGNYNAEGFYQSLGGKRLDEGYFELDGKNVAQVRYGWHQVSDFKAMKM